MTAAGATRWSVVAVLALSVGIFFAATQRMGHSVWLDESHTYEIASQKTYTAVMETAREIRPYPPLYFFLAHHLLQIRPDETILRLASAVFGALGVLALFLLGRELAGAAAGTAAAFFYALTPGAFRYFVDANAYSLLALESAVSTLFLWRAARGGRARDWIGYTAFALAGLATHSLFLFHLAAQLAAGIYLVRRGAEGAGRGGYRRLAVAGAVLLAAAAAMAWYVSSGAHSRPMDVTRVFRLEPATALPAMYLGPLSMGTPALLAIWCPLQALGAIALFRRYRAGFWTLAILTGAATVTITVFLLSTLSYVAYRYAMGVFPLTCVVAGAALGAFAPRARAARLAVGAVMLAYGAAGAAFLAQAETETFGYQDWRSAVAYLRRAAAPGELVLAVPRLSLTPLTYYYGKSGVSTADTAEAAAAAARLLPENGRPDAAVWIAHGSLSNNSRWVARFTETGKPPAAGTREKLMEALGSRGLVVCETAEFLRVAIWAVRRGGCRAR